MIIGGAAERILQMFKPKKQSSVFPRTPVDDFIIHVAATSDKLGFIFNPFDPVSVITAAVIKRRMEYTVEDRDSADRPLFMPSVVMVDAIHNLDTTCDTYFWIGVKPNTNPNDKKAFVFKTLKARHYFANNDHDLTAFDQAKPNWVLDVEYPVDPSLSYSLLQLFGLHTNAFGAHKEDNLTSGIAGAVMKADPIETLSEQLSLFTREIDCSPLRQEEAIAVYANLSGALDSLSTQSMYEITHARPRIGQNPRNFKHATRESVDEGFARYCRGGLNKAARLFNRQHIMDSEGRKHEMIFFAETGFDRFFLTRTALSIAPYYCNLTYGMNGHVYDTNYPNFRDLRMKDDPIPANVL